MATAQTDELQPRLAEQLATLAKTHSVPGASAAVLIDGQVSTAVTGVVNRRTGVEVTPDSLFMIQSTTKLWTATLVLQLVDDGLLALDDPVRQYLPEFRTASEPASAQVTVRQLLTHTGGFEGDLWAATTCGPDALTRFVCDLVPSARQHSNPGERYSYCNAGYGVLGRLVEVLRAASYPEAFRRHLAEPLGIQELAFDASEALAFRTAIGHAAPAPGRPEQPLRTWAIMPPSNPAAGNQLAMSARSLIAFAQLHLDDGVAATGQRLVSVRSARAMREWQVDHPGSAQAHGLGWFLDQRGGLVEHSGGALGVASLLVLVPAERIAIAVLTNGGTAGRLIRDFVDPLLAEFAGVQPNPTLPTPAADARVDRAERYVGRFGTRVSDYEITADAEGRLWLTESELGEALAMAARAGVQSQPETFELRPAGGETFRLVDGSGSAVRTVVFIGQDEAGRARLLHAGRANPRVD